MVKETTLSPQEVREILNSDNKEIIRLCKLAAITPRQNSKGYTYFSYDEVKRLKILREECKQAFINSKHFKTFEMIKSAFYELAENLSESDLEFMNKKFRTIEGFFEDFEKIKSENETLKLKVARISKENCYLKDQIEEYKPLGLGVYIKAKKRDYSI